MDFVDLPTGPGEFFKFDTFKDAPALLVEVKKYEPQKPGKFGPKDTITATIHRFDSAEDVAAGAATVHQDVQISSGALVKDLRDNVGVGKATISKVEEVLFKAIGKMGPVWRNVDPSLKAGVVAYAKAYTERLEADMDDAPSFGDD